MDVTDLFQQLRILLVDDEPFVRKVTTKVLGSLNINQVVEAENGREAIKLFAQHEVNLLITDIQMPEMNGIDLIKHVRMGEASCDRGIRTIVATSFSNTGVLGSCLDLNINGFLVKPVTPASAAEKIRQALNEKTHLKANNAYAQVKTDLASLAGARNKEGPVRASISRESRESSSTSISKAVTLRSLKPGMVLQENLYARHGVKLLSAGQVLDEGLINRINELSIVIDILHVRVRS